MTRQAKIGFICGSFRGQNGAGITSWIENRLTQLQTSGTTDNTVAVQTIDTHKPPFPLGPLYDNYVPATVQESSQYPSPEVAEWSKIVASLSGLIIVTPQYNWGYPGELKNTFDHIFNEMKGLPVVVVTYGGHGGNKAGLQLRQVLEGGMKVNMVSQGELEIVLPKDYIVGPSRVSGEGAGSADFLQNYEKIADKVLLRLVDEAIAFSKARAQ